MSVLTRIADLSVEDVREAIRTALRGGLNQNFLLNFISSVDWGGASGLPEVRDLLGRIELWATEYDEYDLSLIQYIGRLLSVLPPDERSLNLFIGPSGAPQVLIDPVLRIVSLEAGEREVSVSPQMQLVEQV